MLTRRLFLLSSAACMTGCAGQWAATTPAPPGSTQARAPAVGQRWRYAKHDGFSGDVIDTEVDRVVSVGATVQIHSQSQAGAPTGPAESSWGADWLQPYLTTLPVGPLPAEIQRPWGMVLVDDSWPTVQVYREPIPLWPSELRAGWSKTIDTEYKTPDHPDPMPWQITMEAHGWEELSVPAGRFRVLRYTNLINFDSERSGRRDAERHETVWFAPDIGRWAARETSGHYLLSDTVATQRLSMSSFRWELLSWS